MFENKLYNGIHYSRYIASWVHVGGNPCKEREAFGKWLRSIGLPDSVVREIQNIAENGKLELETSALRFRKGMK